MSRPQKIALQKKGRTWYVRFQHKGERLRKSLQTDDESIAKEIVRDLARLMADETTIVHPTAYQLYFGEKPAIEADNARAKIIRQLKKYETADSDTYILGQLAERVDQLEQENAKLLQENQRMNEELQSLKNDKEIKRLNNYRNFPTFTEIITKYQQEVKHLHQKGKNHITLLTELIEHTNAHNDKIDSLSTQKITNFLDAKYYKGSTPTASWNRKRIDLHKLYKWMSINYDIENLISKIKPKKTPPKILKNWHTIEEIEKEIKQQNEYWGSIIANMAYAGLSAHELRGLKTTDYDGTYIIIQPHAERRTKTDNRTRKIFVHEKYLKPRLDHYLENKKQSPYLFPSATSGSEQWTTYTFSRHLNEKIKTPGMNALSLRRTFGSLLLRDGKTETEVAAAMGNTTTMVRQHYARLLGEEIKIQF